MLAALLQATVAVVLVGAAALILNATASQMNGAADWLPLASAAGVAAIGLWLSWRKGRALVAALRLRFERAGRWRPRRPSPGSPGGRRVALPRLSSGRRPRRRLRGGRMVRPRQRPIPPCSGPLSWRDAAGTVIAAGARPCSGAILILVFALAQGVFAAGIAATFAMALGVAVTTGALAWMAVFAKSVAVRFAAGQDSRAALVARTFEFAASLAVLAFGLALLVGARGGA